MDDLADYSFDVFISYAEADSAWLQGYLLDALREAGVRCHSEAAFALGTPRLLEFECAIQQSRRTLLVFSPAYLSDESNRFVELLAQSYGIETTTWPVIPLILHPVKLPPRLGMLTSLDATDPQHWSEVIERLCRELQRSMPEPPPRLACPYPGMVPFGARDARFFYGREAEIPQMLQHLRHQRLLLIVGSSGSGKTSLIIAGLLPRLQESTFFPPGSWLVRTMRPGNQPLQTLSQIVDTDLAQSAQVISNLLTAHPPAQRLLLVIDQFEELFTQASRPEQAKFIAILQGLRAIESCALVIALRADFYSDLMNSDLWPLAPAERLEITPLRGAALRDAIAKPAERQRVYLEAGLVEHLLADAADEPGALPLVQETMVQLWDRMERRLIPLSAYERLGSGGRSGLAVAMVTKADATLAQLTPQQQAIARRIFLRLVQFGEGRADTRRQQPVSALRSGDDDPQMFAQTLHHLTDNRLLTLSGEETDADKRVDIAHEALFTGWPTLQSWLSARREAEQTRRRLEAKAAEWVHLGRGRSALLDDVELREAMNWLKSLDAADLGYDEALPALVRESRAAIRAAEHEKEAAHRRELQAAQKLAETERQRAETERKARVRQRYFMIGLAISLFVATIMLSAAIATSYFAVGQSNARATAERKALAERDAAATAEAQALQDRDAAATADAQALHDRDAAATAERKALAERDAAAAAEAQALQDRDAAEQAREIALSRELATSAITQLSTDPELSLLLSMQAVRTSNTLEARAALRRSLVESHLHKVLRGDTSEVGCVEFSLNGDLLLTCDGGTARVWDIGAGKLLAALRGHTRYLTSAHFNSDGSLIVTASHDGTARVWETSTGVPVSKLQVVDNDVWSAVFGPDSKFVITEDDQKVRVWDLSTNKVVTEIDVKTDQTSKYRTVISPSGRLVVNTEGDGTARIWEAATGRLISELHENYPVYGVAFSPDGKVLLTISDDNTAQLWDTSTGQLLSKLAGHIIPDWGWLGGYIFSGAAFNHDGTLIATVNDDNALRVWKTITGELISEFRNQPAGFFWQLEFSPDSRFLLTVDNPSHARFWDVGKGKMVAELTGRVTGRGSAWSPDSRFIVTSAYNDKTMIWEADTGEIVAEMRGVFPMLSSPAFSSDGRFIVTLSGGTVQVWDWNRESLVPRCDSLKGALALGLSPDGELAVTVDNDEIGRVCDTRNDKIVAELSGTAGQALEVKYSLGNRFVLITNKEETVQVWEVSSGKLVAKLPGFNAAFSPDGNFVVTAGYNMTTKVWELSTGKVTAEFAGLMRSFDDVAFSPDGKFVGVAGSDATAQVWNVETGKLMADLKGHTDRVYRIAFSPNGRFAATASFDKTARIWDMHTGKLVSELLGHSDLIRIVKFSQDSKLLVTGGDDRSARVWEVDTGKSVSVLSPHTNAVYDVASSSDSAFVATVSSDGAAQVWEASTGAVVTALPGHVWGDVEFSKDGKFLFTQGNNGRVQIYRCDVCLTSITELLSLAQTRVTRELSCAERRTYLHENGVCIDPTPVRSP